MQKSQQANRQGVELVPGHYVDPDFSEVIFGPGAEDGSVATWRIYVHVDPVERVPRYNGHDHRPPRPLLPEQVDDERLRSLLKAAVAKHAARRAAAQMIDELGEGWAVSSRIHDHYPDAPTGMPMLDDDELERVATVAAATATPRLGRRPVSDERKLEILELYRTKGLRQTEELTGLAESTIRHHVTAARRIEAARKQAGGVK